MSLLVVDRETVKALLPLEVCIPLVRRAMASLSAGETRQVLRQIIDLDHGNLFGIMPGAMAESFGAKLISIFPANTAAGGQSHQGFVALFDPASGAPVAALHAGEITRIRTAAATAAATDALALSDAPRLAILGTGEQAEAHALAIAKVRRLDEIRLWGRSASKAAVLAARLAPLLGLPVTAAPTVREAVAGAEIVVTATGAVEPVLAGAWVAEGAHVNLVGSSHAGPREVDDALVVRGRLFADHREGVLRQGAEFLHAKAQGLIDDAHVLGEIGAVFSGANQGRLSASEVTLYKSLGSIVQDLAAGWHVYRQAVAQGLGSRVAF